MKKLRSLRTDGAVAYAGVEFLAGLALLTDEDALPVDKHHIGCSGNNKNSQDAHFATAGQAVDRLVNSGRSARHVPLAACSVPRAACSVSSPLAVFCAGTMRIPSWRSRRPSKRAASPTPRSRSSHPTGPTPSSSKA